MAQTHEVRGVATRVHNEAAFPFRTMDGEEHQLVNATVVTYHGTDVAAAAIRNGLLRVILNPGGWFTATTKLRMNQFANQYDLPFSVYQKDHQWYVGVHGKSYELDGPLYIEFYGFGDRPAIHAEKLDRVY